jgi:hypothetical protein
MTNLKYPSSRSLAIHTLFTLLLLPAYRLALPQSGTTSWTDLQHSLAELSKTSADPCEQWDDQHHDEELETKIFYSTIAAVLADLNETPRTSSNSEITLWTSLVRAEKESASLNASWPADKRLRFHLLRVPPLFVIKMTIRTHERFIVVAPSPDGRDKGSQRWTRVGADNDYPSDSDPTPTSIQLYPIRRGPSGAARFLAYLQYIGCAGNSFGVSYDLREWDAKTANGLLRIIRQPGAFGLDQAPARPTPKNPFPSIGTLRTKGSLITIPYCWFSSLDTWNNPSLCAADTYSVAGDRVTFHSRSYNRPDLVPIARVSAHIEEHEYPAIRAWCASPSIARKLLRFTSGFGSSGELEVKSLTPTRERVKLGGGERFEVRKFGDHWLITSFSLD